MQTHISIDQAVKSNSYSSQQLSQIFTSELQAFLPSSSPLLKKKTMAEN